MNFSALFLLFSSILAQAADQEKIVVSFKDPNVAFFNRAGSAWPQVELRPDTQEYSRSWKTQPSDNFFGSIFPEIQDWSFYDYIGIDIFNDGNATVAINFEMHDKNTNDYWSRVNFPITVRPGANHIKVPCNLGTGELSRPSRQIDPSLMKAIFFGRYDTGKDRPTLYLSEIKLVKRDIPEHAGVLAFDFGAEDSPLFPGYTRFTPNTNYDEKLGYGLTPNSLIFNTYAQGTNVLRPDSLYQDSMLFVDGGIQVDLPNGVYEVFMNIDYAGGFWGEYPFYMTRSVFAQGNPVLVDSQTRESLLKRYYRFEKEEDKLDDDIFDKYDPKIFQPVRFRVEVTDGKLNLKLTNHYNFGLALSAMVIYPVALKEKGENFLNWTAKLRKDEFESYFRKVTFKNSNKKPSLKPNEGGLLFKTDLSLELQMNYYPTDAEKISKISLFSNKSETENFSFGVYTETASEFTASISDLKSMDGTATLPASQVAFFRPSHRVVRQTMDGSQFGISEKHLIPSNVFQSEEESSRRVWGQIKVPETTQPGIYQATVTLTFKNGSELRLPLELQVFKSKILLNDFPIGPFRNGIQENYYNEWFPGGLDLNRRDTLIQKSLEKMREVGLTQYSLDALIFLNYNKDLKAAFLDTSFLSKWMKQSRDMGFQKIVSYGQTLSNMNLCTLDVGNTLGISEEEFFAAFVKSLSEQAKTENWLPLDIIVCDEVLPYEFDRVSARIIKLNQVAELYPDSKITFGTTLSVNSNDAESSKFTANIKRPYINSFDTATLNQLKANQHDWVFYNRSDRVNFGFFLYKLTKQSSVVGRMGWVWNQNQVDPFYGLDSREDDYGWCTGTEAADLVCTPFFEGQIREGIKDFRVAKTLEKMIAENATHAQIEEAKKTYQKIMETSESPAEPTPGHQDIPSQQLNALRIEALMMIDALGEK